MTQAPTVGIVGAGDMGSAIGGALVAHGCRVITDLTGRSAETLLLAGERGLRNVGSLAAIASEADVLLSILPPASAAEFARRFLAEVPQPRAGFTFVDCNAVTPGHVRDIAADFIAAGIPFIDVGIVGAPPGRGTQPTRFYASGPRLDVLLALDGMGLTVKPMGPEIGRASAIKMMFAAENKGVMIMQMAIVLAAHRLGVYDELAAELAQTKPAVWAGMERSLPGLAAVSQRWHGEMFEIAATLEEAGVSGEFHHGAAWLMELLSQTSLATETRRTTDRSRSIKDTIEIIERDLGAKGKP